MAADLTTRSPHTLMIRQNELFPANALGPYDVLLKAIGRDPAMMIYLNTADSSAAHPNENYSRELMELFAMGEGNYTEDDVRGWSDERLRRFCPPADGPEFELPRALNSGKAIDAVDGWLNNGRDHWLIHHRD